jgi:tetratricopeptide (TPR) repeat protein
MKTPGLPADSETQLRLLLQDLELALDSTTQRAAKWRGWQALCQSGPYGDDVLLYSQTALSEFEAAHVLDEQDSDALHHLAIAYHALAWDSELRGDFDVADKAWQQALFYWRSLQSCGDFWQALIEKGNSLKGFDPQTIETFRRDLLTYLLEIHVEFIRFYYGQNQTALAARHISIIQHARIPPVARKQLEDLVYQALSEFVPNLLADGRYEDALKRLDDCLQFIPNHTPLLTTYVEIAQEWAQQLPDDCEWALLEEINQRVPAHWDALHVSDPLAVHVLFDLASLLGERFWRRAENLVKQRFESDTGHTLPFFGSEEEHSYQYAIAWMKKTLATASETNWIECNLSLCQARLALLTGLFTTPWEDANRAFEEGIQYYQNAIDLLPQEDGPRKALSQVLYVRALVAIQDHGLPPENYKIDLIRAQLLNPENDELKKLIEHLNMTPDELL